MELKKNDEVSLEIIDLTNTGEGIGKIDGFPLFVKKMQFFPGIPGRRPPARVPPLFSLPGLRERLSPFH